jgi:hypothetical protein
MLDDEIEYEDAVRRGRKVAQKLLAELEFRLDRNKGISV